MSASTFASVVRAEWRSMLRNRVAVAGVALMLLLTLTAILGSHEQMSNARRDRLHFESTAEQQWAAQPDRHPHRVVHYGHFIFRPLSPLAFFDFGIAPLSGNALFLEGHRQNSANFSEASQSSILLRFGQLTPAYVLQVLTPLLIVFLAFGSVAREREQGQLRMQMANGMRGAVLLWGKLASHGALALLLAAPAFVALAVIGVLYPAQRGQALWMLGGYTMYLLLWVFVAVLVSASVARARDALLVLVGCWMLSVVLLPRIMPDIAAHAMPQPTRIETEVAIHKALAALGDSHNPDDPHFNKFKEKTLARYGVSRIEDLPVNYGGLVTEEGERLSGELYAQSMQGEFARQAGQSGIVQMAAIASPVLALRRLSSALAGTDLDTHTRFLLEGERYRYALIQSLNRLHVTEVHQKNDRDQRISSEHWRAMPRFAFQSAALETVTARHAWPGIAIFSIWLAVLCGAAGLIAKRLERTGQ
jgi:ABC-2 type transport system permease protein